MSEKSKLKTEPVKTADKIITLTFQQAFTYSVFLLTVGASVYTFFKAIPKIDQLDESVNQLRVSNGKVEERIEALKATISVQRSEQNHTSIEAVK